MTNKTPWIIGAIIAIVFVGVGAMAISNNSKSKGQDTSMTKSSEVMSNNSKALMKEDGVMKEGDHMMLDGKSSWSNEEMQKMQKEDSMMIKEGESMMKNDDVMMKKTGYIDYSSAALTANGEGKNIIFFKASWCPTCKSLDADITSNANKIPEGVNIMKADYDTSSELKKKYGVTQQHTLVVVDKDGNKISSKVGSPTLDSVLALVK